MIKTPAEIRAMVTQYIIENNNGEITGEQMRTILIDLIDTMESGITTGTEQSKSKKDIPVTTDGTWISFDEPFAEGTEVLVLYEVRSDTGVKIACDFLQESATQHEKFKITPIWNGTLKYVAFPV